MAGSRTTLPFSPRSNGFLGGFHNDTDAVHDNINI